LPGKRLIISSGFISEGKRFSLLDSDNLLPLIKLARDNSGLKEIITIAGKFNMQSKKSTWKWRDKYQEFVGKLKKIPKIKVKDITEENWHAKVSLKITGGRPIAAIIGSSNLTTAAYGKYKYFNKECDVVIWYDAKNGSDFGIRSLMEKWGDFNHIYFEKIEKGPKEEERLKDIYNEIKEDLKKRDIKI
jgi:hypothetical protein